MKKIIIELEHRPYQCDVCPCYIDSDSWCNLIRDNVAWWSVPSKCPIKEVEVKDERNWEDEH